MSSANVPSASKGERRMRKDDEGRPDGAVVAGEAPGKKLGERKPVVAVYGAGIAGLTVAHELATRGYSVTVYEALSESGGFFRSARPEGPTGMPTEYSWHGMGPWYQNVFDLLKQIPFDETGSVYERALSRQIDFGIFPDDQPAEFYDKGLGSIPRMFRFGRGEFLRWSWLMLKVWCSRQRSEQQFSRMNAAACCRPLLCDKGYMSWRACFGPWIGSDWTKVSLHHCGHFFRRQLVTKPTHAHPADEQGPAWSHGAGDGWLLLRGPSSEVWFHRWIPWLEKQGVQFHWDMPLHSFKFDGKRVSSAVLADGSESNADVHVLATNPFAAAEIVERSGSLASLQVLREFRPLVKDGPHLQISLRIAFRELICFPRPRTAVVLSDTEYNLTLFAQEQAWRKDQSLGEGIVSLWTVTSCAGNVPGRIFKLPAAQCSKTQFIFEVRAQILGCGALDEMIREANGGRSLADFEMTKIEVWHEWKFSPVGITGPQPKWVTTTRNQAHRPSQRTPVENLLLAGAHTRTAADVWSIEGAVESGRLAAREVEPSVEVKSQYDSPCLIAIWRVDDLLFRFGLPHVLSCAVFALAVGALVLAGFLFYRR
ncbi:MAG: FAD-dependent oxidoreductase [Opitutaceae bacterium]|nr:FAD-dependent oxidoreductase [Opitutaceae bacterium]